MYDGLSIGDAAVLHLQQVRRATTRDLWDAIAKRGVKSAARSPTNSLYTVLSNRTEVTLNMEKYVALQAKFESSRRRQRELRAMISQGGGNQDAYLSEVIEIVGDYLKLLRG